MRRLLHLSDLHFGRIRDDLTARLLDRINRAAVDLVVISGDLTQRARHVQFEAAKAFVSAIDAPVLCVPGNHDVPLHRPFLRLFRPYARYRAAFGAVLEPQVADTQMAVAGLNTVNPLSWQRGKVRAASVRRACALFGRPGRMNIVVAHHPFEQGQEQKKALARGADRAIAQFAECGAHIVLSGHLHSWRAEPFLSHAARGMLQIHAGTGLSSRLRNEPNDFAELVLHGDAVDIVRHISPPGDSDFHALAAQSFQLRDGIWVASEPD